uniref:Uncharacterized protein n=1 Tax=Amphimedon queenslandica TaxID=400682 RepID=A0A1X7VBJ0_AMPQE
MNVKEAHINNRQEQLCFSTSFAAGLYGQHHFRQSYPVQTLSFSEDIKSSLLNKIPDFVEIIYIVCTFSD